MSLPANISHGKNSATMTLESRAPPLLARRDSLSGRTMRNGKNIDVGGVKPLVTRTEIHCGRPGNLRTNAGKPTYKSQEEQYQEIQELRRSLGELREENSSLKTRSRRLEEDLIRRDRQIDQLMDPAKVVRLRNQLNIVQQQQQYQKPSQQSSPHHQSPHQHQQPPPPPPQQDTQVLSTTHWSNMRGGHDSREGMRCRRDGGDGQESPTTNLRHALAQLEEENARLGHQVSSLAIEKDKLEADLERVLGVSDEAKNNYEGVSRAELIREVERSHEEVNRWEAQHTQLTEALARRNDHAGDASSLFQAHLAEMQGREVEWDRERSSLRELINTLKDDRMFYMETAQKKDSELDSLRTEIQTLQQEILALHETQRKQKERVPGTLSQRSYRGSGKQVLSSGSRSGSSSDANTPTRRTRPSSARPPAPGTRPQRSPKSSSEPREIPTPSKIKKSTVQQVPKKTPPPKSPSKTSSSPSKSSASNIPSSVHSTRPGNSNRKPATSSSTSTPKASPYGSPRHGSTGRVSSSVSSKTPTPTGSPRKNASSMSPLHKPFGASPQHRLTGSVSPQPRHAGLSSPAKSSTSRSSSRTSTPSSSKSSPLKVNATSKSPSKVPQPKIGSSPSKSGKRQESSSPSRSPRKQDIIKESSAEEDERVLAEILFHQETGNSGEPSSASSIARQRTMTISVNEDVSPANNKADSVEVERASSSKSLIRQDTVTLSKTDDENTSAQCSKRDLRQDTIVSGEEEISWQEKNGSDSMKKSADMSNSGASQDSEIIESLELLQSLLSSHLSRQREVNELLNCEPLLVGKGQGDTDSQETPRGRGRSTREAPDGEESARASCKHSQSLVRQGTFNIYDQEPAVATIHATLDAHLTRVNKVQQFSSN
ncbi:hypothetical protein OTU49_005952 [Cherax quadricarinatus]|uniref:Uncharacterized protein n=1 Tax=Cherax quadricarinatus TaxID=27406 RepID=A0AAW0X6D7_CHEQU